MIPAYTREEVVRRLRDVVEKGAPILAVGASAGLIAKCAELGGADLIVVYSSGKSRLMGLPTTVIGDSNKVTLEMFEEINNIIERTPIIGGVESSDPTHLNLDHLVRKFKRVGFTGVINFPTLGVMPERSRQREDVGLGYSRDIQMIGAAHQLGLFTMAYVFDPEQSRAMAKAGADCIVAHVGWTVGGLAGAKGSARPMERALTDIQAMFESALAESDKVFCLAHGGPISSPEDTRILYERTTAQGFVGASSIERIPIEQAVLTATWAFKSIKLGKTSQ